MTARVQVRRSDDRFVTRAPGVETRHSFSFGPHWDPQNTAFGRLVLHDEHRLAPGAGFPPHPHRGVDVVTCVLEGELVHEDDTGRRVRLGAGSVAHLRTGTGVVHSETAGSDGARFVQAWLVDERPGAPTYVTRSLRPELDDAVRLDAGVLHAGRLAPGPAALPQAALMHVFVASGEVDATTPGGRVALGEGDALRVTGGGVALEVPVATLLVVWTLHDRE